MNNIIKLNKMILSGIKKYGFHSVIQILIIALKSLWVKNQGINCVFLNFSIKAPSPRLLLALLNEIFFNEEYLLPTTHIKNSNPLILDCGSNIGISILYWKHKFSNPKIIAFEPFENFYNFIKLNTSANNIDVQIENVALGRDNSNISFFSDNENLTTGSLTRSRGGKYEYIVPQRKLSKYIEEFEYIDLIKMDIEGSEVEVLNDLFINKQIIKCKLYIIEYHLHIGDKESQKDFENIISKFTSLDYCYTIKSTNFSTGGFQDILIFFNKN
jgi:FkbM family methyltransferase